MKHLEFSEILDLVENRLEKSAVQKLEGHLEQCEPCAEKKAWAEKSLHAMKEHLIEAPEYAVRKAIALFPERKKGIVEWIRASLDFDSWTAMETAGVRSAHIGPRQCVYVTDAYRVALMLEPGKTTSRVTGQLMARTPGAEASHCLIEVSAGKKILGETTTGSSGEFLLEVPRNKDLQMKIHGDPESVLISFRL